MDTTDIDRWEEWGGAGSAGGGIRRTRAFDVPASVSGGEEATLGGLPPERGTDKMPTSWPEGIVASMDGGKDGE